MTELYNIPDLLRNMQIDPETGEILGDQYDEFKTAESTSAMVQELGEKDPIQMAIWFAKLADEKNSNAKHLAEHIKHCQEKKASAERSAEWLKQRGVEWMKLAGQSKVKDALISMSVGKRKSTVWEADCANLSDEQVQQLAGLELKDKIVTTSSISKKDLTDWMKANSTDSIDGICHIEEKESITIRK